MNSANTKSWVPLLGVLAALVVVGVAVLLTARVAPPAPSSVDTASSTPSRDATPLSSGSAAAVSALSPEARQEKLAQPARALENALVNIVCRAPGNSKIQSMTGSGVIIGENGFVLTNAHVGQYFLLKGHGVSCALRTGAPAEDRYRAELAYISPFWITANQTVLTDASPKGTGEYDFAVLAITESATAAALPSSFPSVPLASASLQQGAPVAAAAYVAPAPVSEETSLFSSTVFDTVQKLYTFATQSVDVIAFPGAQLGQEGSSGGGVVNEYGRLAGTITASSDERVIYAITAPYIRRAYKEETGESIEVLLAQSPAAAAENFAYRIPALESIISAQLR